MSERILISGAGQLGSRYLQGLVRSTRALQIHVHDVDPVSLERALSRWREVASLDVSHTVHTHSNLTDIPKVLDVVIVATTARWRPELVSQIAAKRTVGAWILEKVLAQSGEGLDTIAKAVGPYGKAWVNTPRRMLDWHQQIKRHLSAGRAMRLDVDGGAWGLACNAIHFLDMLAWWTGETLLSFDTSALANHWIESKRPGNYEVLGSLTAHFSGGSVAKLSAQDGEVQYRFELDDGVHRWAIDEAAGTARRSDGLELPGRLPFQSEVSAALVDSILSVTACELPTLRQSMEIHRPFISSLLTHWRSHVDAGATVLPIT